MVARAWLVRLLMGFAASVIATAGAAASEASERMPIMISNWYLGVSAEEAIESPQHTAPEIRVPLSEGVEIVIPPHLARMEVSQISRWSLREGLEDLVGVALQCRTDDDLDQAYLLLYRPGAGGMALWAELPLRETFERMDIQWLDASEPALVVQGISGAHFIDFWIWRLTGEEPELLFADGSSAGIELRNGLAVEVPSVWVAIEDWGDPEWSYTRGQRRWNVYTWDGEGFVFNERFSTVREISVGERLAQYTLQMYRKVEWLRNDLSPRSMAGAGFRPPDDPLLSELRDEIRPSSPPPH